MYTLDPDFRRKPPKDKPFCVMCQKEIKNTAKAHKVTVNWDNWTFADGGEELLGHDCYTKQTKGTKS